MSPSEFDDWLSSPPRRGRPLVMGVLNVTPDSFSDGGRFDSSDRGVARGMEMIAEGADLLDVGGESTRPGSLPVPEDVQIERVVPVIAALRKQAAAVTLSVDTTRAAVAEAALDAGADVVNDVSAGRDDPGLLPLVARRGAAVILMHMRGTPATMQDDPRYEDVTREVGEFLRHRTSAATAARVDERRVLLDPGIGFGKNADHNLELLRRLADLSGLGRPLVVGTSRKGFIGKVTGVADPSQRLFGTAATVAWAVANGAGVVRVHDVGPMSQVARMVRAIQTGKA
jgi:dihydropteroate synthase